MIKLDNLHESVPSIIAIFTFVLIVSGNYLGELFPCKVQQMFSENMLIKHFLGYLTLVFFVVLTVPELSKSNNMLISSAFMYLAFLFASKTQYKFWFSIFGVTGIIYLLYTYKKSLLNKETPVEEMTGEADKEVPVEETKESAVNNSIVKHIDIANNVLTGVIGVLATVGFLAYMGEKKFEYGKKFSYLQFFLGKPSCRQNKLKNNTLMMDLAYAFK